MKNIQFEVKISDQKRKKLMSVSFFLSFCKVFR